MSEKIYLAGKDGVGWNIDKDRQFFTDLFADIDISTAQSPLSASHIFVLWWNVIFSPKYLWLRLLLPFKKFIVVITNDISQEDSKISLLIRCGARFVCANPAQREKLLELGCLSERIEIIPYYVDETIFYNQGKSREELCALLGISYEETKDKVLIGSLQRDSAGADLQIAKWHKNPDGLVAVASQLPPNYLWVLGGPRRHYLVNKFKEKNIPYIFVGNDMYHRENRDDITANNLPDSTMSLLYNLIDVYVVTSVSEGGPKAIPESVLTDTLVLSTDVGFAKMLLPDQLICEVSGMSQKLVSLLDNKEAHSQSLTESKTKTTAFYNRDYFLKKLRDIVQ